jgi:hypothetical protein
MLDVEEVRDRFQLAPLAIWRSLKYRCRFFGEGRMLGETLRDLVATAEQGRKHFPTTLCAKAEAQVGRCSSRSTVNAANLASVLLVHQFTLSAPSAAGRRDIQPARALVRLRNESSSTRHAIQCAKRLVLQSHLQESPISEESSWGVQRSSQGWRSHGSDASASMGTRVGASR